MILAKSKTKKGKAEHRESAFSLLLIALIRSANRRNVNCPEARGQLRDSCSKTRTIWYNGDKETRANGFDLECSKTYISIISDRRLFDKR